MNNNNASRLTPEEFALHTKGCIQNKRESQEKIYHSFYGYAMSICSFHAATYEDAVEIVNDGFLKIFQQIKNFSPVYCNEAASFLGWLRQIMVHTAIDHYRRNKKHNNRFVSESEIQHSAALSENGPDNLLKKEIMQAINQLTPAYRNVMQLRVVEGFSHKQIAQHLGISVSTSKTNFFKARVKIQGLLTKKECYYNFSAV